jgi:hypothetical protein
MTPQMTEAAARRRHAAATIDHGDMQANIVVIINRDHLSQPRPFSIDRDLHYHSFHYILTWRPKYLHKIQKGTAPRNGGGNE